MFVTPVTDGVGYTPATRKDPDEAHVPTEPTASEEDPWIPDPDANQGRPTHPRAQAGEGPREAQRLG